MAEGHAWAVVAARRATFTERFVFSAASSHCRGAEGDEEFIISVRNCSPWATELSPGH